MLAVAFALAVLGGLVERSVIQDDIASEREALEAETASVALLVPDLLARPGAAMEAVVEALDRANHGRFTFVAADGTVLAGAAAPDIAASPEVVEAAARGTGASVRNGPSSDVDDLYVASAVRDGGRLLGFVRVAVPVTRLKAQREDLRLDLAEAALVAGIGAFVIAFLFARALVRPVLRLVGGVRGLARGEVAHAIDARAPGEIGVDAAWSVRRLSPSIRSRRWRREADPSLDEPGKLRAERVVLVRLQVPPP